MDDHGNGKTVENVDQSIMIYSKMGMKIKAIY